MHLFLLLISYHRIIDLNLTSLHIYRNIHRLSKHLLKTGRALGFESD